MSLFAVLKNKHVVLAMLIAPLLAVFAWYATGWLLGDTSTTPVLAQPGDSYPLLERSGCRYGGGKCVLANEDVELAIAFDADGSALISSTVPLESVLLALRSDAADEPVAGIPVDAGAALWRVELNEKPQVTDALRLAVVAGGSAYFGEASLTFTGPRNR